MMDLSGVGRMSGFDSEPAPQPRRSDRSLSSAPCNVMGAWSGRGGQMTVLAPRERQSKRRHSWPWSAASPAPKPPWQDAPKEMRVERLGRIVRSIPDVLCADMAHRDDARQKMPKS